MIFLLPVSIPPIFFGCVTRPFLSDESDENGCQLLLLKASYNKMVPPVLRWAFPFLKVIAFFQGVGSNNDFRIPDASAYKET